MFFTGVEEGWGGGLETAGHDLVNQVFSECCVTVGEGQCHHADAVFVAFEVASAVESLERVGRVVLVGAEEGWEAEFDCVGPLEEGFNEGEVVFVDYFLFVVVVVDEVVEFFFQVVEEHGVLVDVLEEELVGRFPVFVELDKAVFVVQVKQGVECVVVHAL